MRMILLVFALTASACAKEEPVPKGIASGTFTSGARDALCIAGSAGAQRAGFIVYGIGDANCSASGRIAQAGANWLLIPQGDAECKIPLSIDPEGVSLDAAMPACAYYCGPTASFAGRAFTRAPDAKPVIDLAGDPLC